MTFKLSPDEWKLRELWVFVDVCCSWILSGQRENPNSDPAGAGEWHVCGMKLSFHIQQEWGNLKEASSWMRTCYIQAPVPLPYWPPFAKALPRKISSSFRPLDIGIFYSKLHPQSENHHFLLRDITIPLWQSWKAEAWGLRHMCLTKVFSGRNECEPETSEFFPVFWMAEDLWGFPWHSGE